MYRFIQIALIISKYFKGTELLLKEEFSGIYLYISIRGTYMFRTVLYYRMYKNKVLHIFFKFINIVY